MAKKRRRLNKAVVAVAVCALLVAESTAAAKLFRRNRCKCVCQKPCVKVCEHETPADCEQAIAAEAALPVDSLPVKDASSEPAPEPAAEVVSAEPPAEEPVTESEVPNAAVPPVEMRQEIIADLFPEEEPADPEPALSEEPAEDPVEEPVLAESAPVESDDELMPWKSESPEDSLVSSEATPAEEPQPAETPDPEPVEPEPAEPDYGFEDSLFADDSAAEESVVEEPARSKPIAQTSETPDEQSFPWDEAPSTEEYAPVAVEPEPVMEPITETAPVDSMPAEVPEDDDDSWLADFDPKAKQPAEAREAESTFEDMFGDDSSVSDDSPTESEPSDDLPAESDAVYTEPLEQEPAEEPPVEQEPAPAVDPLEGLFASPSQPEEPAEEEPAGEAEQEPSDDSEPSMEEMFQGPRDRSSSNEPADYRTWFDQTGRYSVEAEMLAATGDRVLLGGRDGVRWGIAYQNLSDSDLKFVQQELATLSRRGDATPAMPVSTGTQQR